MNILENLVIPFVGPGCCHDRACTFYWYEFYHLPVEGCPSWESYKKDATVNNQIDPNFNINEFMDYACNEIRWRCHQRNCPLWRNGMHSQALVNCVNMFLMKNSASILIFILNLPKALI